MKCLNLNLEKKLSGSVESVSGLLSLKRAEFVRIAISPGNPSSLQSEETIINDQDNL